jgi:phosphopantetheine--protein transferase-like protein
VDLISQPNIQKSTDSRFLKKILTDTEIEQVRSSSDPDAALWSFWACKEAAYKVMRKKTSGAAFVPRRWFVRYQADLNSSDGLHPWPNGYRDGEVIISPSDTVYIRLFSFPSYTHCLAADAPEAVSRIVARVDRLPEPENSQTDPSGYVRMKLIHCLAVALGLSEDDMRIVRETKSDGLGPPLLYISGVQSAIDLSISHDGCYVAYAYMV